MSEQLQVLPTNVRRGKRRATELERIFNFRDAAFNAYMKITSPGKNVDLLKELAHDLARSDHPIVQLAAGSAAMELAFRRRYSFESNPENDFEFRKGLLTNAQERWRQAADGLGALACQNNKRDSTPAMQRRLTLLKFQAMQATAFVPLMETPAAWYAQYSLPEDTRMANAQKTNDRLADLAKGTISRIKEGLFSKSIHAGISAEMACGLVGRLNDPLKYLLLPASLRQDCHPSSSLRADFVAFATAKHHPKTLMQIKMSTNLSTNKYDHCLEVIATRDLVLKPGGRVDQTLESFVAVVDQAAEPEIEQRFVELGCAMTTRLDTFHADRLLRASRRTTPGPQ